MSTLRIGVIGTGAMGRDHIATLHRHVADASVVAVYDRDTDVSADVAALVGATVAPSAEALIEADDVDAVIVCSPDPTHQDLVLRCLEAQRPVLCEKPLATSPEGTTAVVAAEAGRGHRLVQVGFMRRYDPAYLDLRKQVRGGALGAPVMLHCVHRNAAAQPGVTAELVVTNSMIHELDVARWLLDEEVVAVTATTVRRGGAWVAGDPVLAWLEMASGVTVEVEAFVNAGYGYDVRCEAVGATGTSSLPPHVVADFQTRFADAYRAELSGWVSSVSSGRPEGPSAWDGHRASVVAEACTRSLLQRQRIDVPQEPRPSLYA